MHHWLRRSRSGQSAVNRRLPRSRAGNLRVRRIRVQLCHRIHSEVHLPDFCKLFSELRPAVPGERGERCAKQSNQNFFWGPRLRPSSNHNPNEQRQININKQNNHNALGNNLRGRRAKINSRTTAGQGVQTDAQSAKRPNVQILTISNVPSDLLDAIDDLAARQDRSRSSFIRRALQRVVAEYQAKESEALSKSR